jgi:hypothetical protein
MLTQERLRELLHYDPETGVFTWARNHSSLARYGEVAGHRRDRYITIGIDGNNHMAHRLAWLYMTGEHPVDEVDHCDGDVFNNRWVNLRPATRKQNTENRGDHCKNTSGYRGVTWYKKNNKWGASVLHRGRRYFAGLFDDVHEAGAAAASLRFELFSHHRTRHTE